LTAIKEYRRREADICNVQGRGKARARPDAMEIEAMNTTRLAIVLYIMAAPVLAGAAVTAVLSLRDYQSDWLAAGALAGFALAVPVAWLAARAIMASRR
jgi:hypothetical protein